MEPLVSVIIPTHNRAELVSKAVESALGQTYKNIEIIVVSDGSTDNTDDVLEEITKKNENVKYISYHPNKGGNVARNTGIKNAMGKYVAFLDDDDVWLPKKLEKQVLVAESDEKIGIVCSGSVTIDEDTGKTSEAIPEVEYESAKRILFNNDIGTTSTVLVRKSILDECNGFDEELVARQDYDLWIRMCQISNVAVVEECLVEYHVSNSNNQISKSTNKYIQATDMLIKKYDYLLSKLSDEERKQIISEMYFVIARKAVKNNQRKLAREYIVKAQKIQLTFMSIAYWFGTFFPADFANIVRKILMKN